MATERSPDFQDFMRARGLIPALNSTRDDDLSKGLAKDLWIEVRRWVRKPRAGVPGLAGQLPNLLAPIYRRLKIEERTEKALAQEISAEPSILLYVIDQLALAITSELQRLAVSNQQYANLRRATVLRFYDGGAKRMNKILDEGGSSWRIDWPHRGLVRQVSRDLQSTYERAIEGDSPSVRYLQDAWDGAMSLTGSASDSFSSAIKSLEAEFGPVVVPDADRPSLGQIISALQDNPRKWEARLASRHWKERNNEGLDDGGLDRVSVITDIFSMLWQARIQHANPDQYEKNDRQDALDAVALTSALIEIQRRGFIWRRTSENDGTSSEQERD